MESTSPRALEEIWTPWPIGLTMLAVPYLVGELFEKILKDEQMLTAIKNQYRTSIGTTTVLPEALIQ